MPQAQKQRTHELHGSATFPARIRYACHVVAALILQCFNAARGENQADYRFEFYAEEDDRMVIKTHTAYFEQQIIDSLTARGELVYDGISGSTPTGTYRVSPMSGLIREVHLEDIRRALHFELDGKLANHSITPGFAYSQESDYTSYGISLSDAIEFNQKNTTFQFGASHNFDSVQRSGNPFPHDQDKNSTEVIFGISQLLSPNTIFSADFTFGYESGFLSDPYRQAEFVYPLHTLGVVRYENRPSERSKEVFLTSLTQFIDPLNGSLEISYRLYHDSFDVFAHTASLTWHQWLAGRLMLEPAFRLYEQSAASFYAPLFFDDPANVKHYSADYRLSNFYSLDYGLQATFLIDENMRVIAGYHRYEMVGLDSTVSSMYPSANIYTVGVSFLW